MENGCLKVVNVDGIFDDMKAEIIGFSISESPSYSTTCQPHRVRLGVVISSERSAKRRIVFNHWRSPKLATPDDEGGIEQAALFEIVDECGRRLIRFFAVAGVVADESGVSVPAFVIDVDESYAALDHAPREEAGAREGRLVWFASVRVKSGFGFAFQIHQFRGAGLKAERHLVCIEPRLNLGIANALEARLIQRRHHLERVSLRLPVDALGRADV